MQSFLTNINIIERVNLLINTNIIEDVNLRININIIEHPPNKGENMSERRDDI